MIITCEDCNTSFNLDESLLKPTGSKVRCSKCKKVFVAYPPQPLEEPEKEEVLDSEETVEKKVEDLDLDIEPEGERDKEEFTEDFEVEFESEAESAADETEVEAKVGEPDDLDLSDLEALLDDEEVPKEESVAEESVEDLDLEMDVESEVAEKAEEVEMDLEFEDSDTIDLTEIEAMLDEEESEIESIDEPEEVELELDTETEFELERPTEELDAVAESDDMSEVDLSDIEKMLEEAIDADTEAELEGDELYGLDGLDLDTDTDELDEGIEIEDMDLGLEKEDSDQEDLIEDEVAEVQEIEKEVTDQFYMETQDLEKAVEEQLGADDLKTEEDKEIPVVKKGLNKPVLVLLIILLLGGGGFGVYALVNYTNVEIPFISDYFKPKVQDPAGNLYIDTLDINSKFVENAREGKLFVVTGKVRNNYKGERSFISITGKLYRKGKILVSPWEKVFCGNALSDIELSNNDLEYLKNKLSNKNGENNSNVGVKPGQELPFMIIFANLPDDLEEFAIEVAGSSAG